MRPKPLPFDLVDKLPDLVHCTLIKVIRPKRRDYQKAGSVITRFRYHLWPPFDEWYVDLPINNPEVKIKHLIKHHADASGHHFADGGIGLEFLLRLAVHKDGYIHAKDYYTPCDRQQYIKI